MIATRALQIICWGFLALMSISATQRGNFAEMGAGMAVFDGIAARIVTDPLILMSSLDICAAGTGPWTVADWVSVTVMWGAMFCLMAASRLRQRTLPDIIAFLTGHLPAVMFFVGLTALLKSYGLLSNFFVLSAPDIGTAMVVLLVIITVVMTLTIARDVPATLSGGVVFSLQCSPLMLLMFVFGLMNILAMIAMVAFCPYFKLSHRMRSQLVDLF